ncbi:MAG: SEL1-like repeat protein [Myxococcales bacterium]|nr:SEL1-like repeat protein [Myxococcales bacterium]
MRRICAMVCLGLLIFGCASTHKPTPSLTPAPPAEESTEDSADHQVSLIEYLEKQAADGDALAQLRLGDLYLTGHGVEADDTLAVAWIRKAALQDQPDALILLGDLYMNGRAVEKDPSEALVWLTRAAEMGESRAQYRVGMVLLYGRGVPADQPAGVRWLRAAAEQGEAQAQYILGAAYKRGLGVQIDFSKTSYWYAKAATQGNVMAQNDYAAMLQDGKGMSGIPWLLPGGIRRQRSRATARRWGTWLGSTSRGWASRRIQRPHFAGRVWQMTQAMSVRPNSLLVSIWRATEYRKILQKPRFGIARRPRQGISIPRSNSRCCTGKVVASNRATRSISTGFSRQRRPATPRHRLRWDSNTFLARELPLTLNKRWSGCAKPLRRASYMRRPPSVAI